MNSPVITIAIIAYCRDFLHDCISSVLAQTYKNIKVIVYDDCSPENLKEIVGQFEDSRLFYHRNENNLKTFGNTNQALQLCETEFVNVFHGDDVMFPWMLETLLDVAMSNPSVDLFLSRAKPTYKLEKSHIVSWCASTKNEGKLFSKNELIGKLLKFGGNIWPPAGILFRKAAINKWKILFRPEIGPAADVFFLVEANNAGMKILDMGQELFFSRRHPHTWTNLATAASWEQSHLLLDHFIASMNLGYDMRFFRMNLGQITISNLSSSIQTEEDIASLWDKKELFAEERQWVMTEQAFRDAIVIGFLGNTVIEIGLGNLPLSEYFQKKVKLKELGIEVTFLRRVKWFLKYLVCQKLFGRY